MDFYFFVFVFCFYFLAEMKNPPKEAKVIAKQTELSRKMFEVVAHLKKCGVEKPQTIEHIEDALHLRLQDNAALIEELRKNERVKFFQGTYSYKPKHDIRNKDELREFLKKKNGVVDENEFQHSFSGVDTILQVCSEKEKRKK
jgi:hypothetical protein